MTSISKGCYMKKSIGTAALLGAMCLALMPLEPVYAANWVYVETSTNNGIYYYDADTVRRSGDEVTVWEKRDHSRDATVKYRSKTLLSRYDCSGRTVVAISSNEHYPNGKTETFKWSPFEQSKTDIAPDTVAESMLEAVCKED
jgi:hypothetical protein